jgi:iron complex outermembrane receptor protein
MISKTTRRKLMLTTALSIGIGTSLPAFAQTTPGDQSGTAQDAGAGQSAATATQAPAMRGQSPAATADAPTAGATNAPTGNATAQSGPVSRSSGTATGGASEGAGDIIVTARRVEERLQDVPISITVFNQQQLTNRNIVQANDLATYTPSLSSNNNFGSQNSSFAIRGFVQDIGTQPSVGVYFADVVAPRAASNNVPAGDGAGPGSFFDLQNVQVLKGPQGTLFGRNTTGGAVLLVPQKPTSRLEGYVEGSYGNYDLKRIQGVLNVPFSDSARFRIGVDHEERDGYLKNDAGIGPNRFGDIDYTAIRGSLVLDLTPDLENYTIVSYLHSNTVGDDQKVINAIPDNLGMFASEQLQNEASKGAGFYTVQNNLPNPQTTLDQWQIINTTTWRASDSLTVKNITSYAQLKEDFRSPLFGTDFDLNRLAGKTIASLGLPASLNPYPVGTKVGFTAIIPVPGGDTANQSTFTEELQFQGTATNFNWQAGGYLELSDPLGFVGSRSPVLLGCSDYVNLICTNPIGAGSASFSQGKTNFRNYGVYAQATYSLSDHFKITGGARYTWDRASSSTQNRNLLVPTPGVVISNPARPCTNPDAAPPVCNISVATRSEKPTWLIDLDYKPTEDVLIYGKYARGYRAGSVSSSSPTEFNTFKPEKVDNFEVGAKTSIRGPIRATFNVAGFYNDFSNQQLQLNLNPRNLNSGVVPSSGIINAGKSRIYGAEVEASVTPFTGFTVDANYTYLHTEIRRIFIPATSADSPFIANTPIEPGDPLALSPKNKVTATATYTLPLDADIGKVSVGATFIHIDKQLTNYLYRDSGGKLDDFSYVGKRNLLNLNLNWNSVFGTPFDVSAFATNVTNRKYYAFIPGLLDTVGFETATLGEPRMYGARLRYRFGG